MNFGLNQHQIDELHKVFATHPEISKVIIFGSRAQGTNKLASDIDFALQGDITLDVLAKVKYQLEEETNLPYFFDVLDYAKLNNAKLKEAIDREGKIFYVSCKKNNKT